MTGLEAAKLQMGITLGWHIIVACFGVALPPMVLLAEWRAQRTGERRWDVLARRWGRVMGLLFAIGAVSGTVLSIEMGSLWPGLLGTFGPVVGFPFALEGYAFFVEAIFVGIYLYGRSRLSPRAHLLSGLPIVVSGVASAYFVISANAWMNDPTGFRLVHGKVVDPQPWRVVFSPAAWPEAAHLILAAGMIVGFSVAGVYAFGLLRAAPSDSPELRRYRRTGLLTGFSFGALCTPVQLLVGDLSARLVARHQPIKLAAMEGVWRTGRHVPEQLLGVWDGHRLVGSIRIPDGLSLLLDFNPDGKVEGLTSVPAANRPPVEIVHFSFDLMVGLGFALFGLCAWAVWHWWRRGALPGSRLFLLATVLSGPAAVVAMESGWVTTEEGRQPWVVQGIMTVEQAVNHSAGLVAQLWVMAAVYAALTAVTLWGLRHLTRTPLPDLRPAPGPEGPDVGPEIGPEIGPGAGPASGRLAGPAHPGMARP